MTLLIWIELFNFVTMTSIHNVYSALDVFILIIVKHILNARVKRKYYFESSPIWTFKRRKFEFCGSKVVKLASLQVKSSLEESHTFDPPSSLYKGNLTSSLRYQFSLSQARQILGILAKNKKDKED